MKPGETENHEELENKANPTTPVEEKKTEDSELEKLRKEKLQAEMRANQLENKLKDKEKAEADAKTKELEEQNEFKSLYEQEQAKREELERDLKARDKRKALRKTEKGILAEYSAEAIDTAKDLGVKLTDDTDDAVTEFKSKLDKLQARVGGKRMTPNNPGKSSTKKEYTQAEMYEILHDPVKRDKYYREQGGVTAQQMGPQA